MATKQHQDQEETKLLSEMELKSSPVTPDLLNPQSSTTNFERTRIEKKLDNANKENTAPLMYIDKKNVNEMEQLPKDYTEKLFLTPDTKKKLDNANKENTAPLMYIDKKNVNETEQLPKDYTEKLFLTPDTKVFRAPLEYPKNVFPFTPPGESPRKVLRQKFLKTIEGKLQKRGLMSDENTSPPPLHDTSALTPEKLTKK